MSDERAIIVRKTKKRPEGYIKISNCRDCSHYHHEGEYCKISDINWIEYSMSKKLTHMYCPLPFLSDVIEHGPDEIPGCENGKNPYRNVLLKLKIIQTEENIVRVCFHDCNLGWRYAENYNVIRTAGRKIISWRELKPNGGTDGID